MDKHFEIGQQNEELQPHYRDQILKIINDRELAIRSVSPDMYLDAETHHEEVLANEEEWKNYEAVRKDVCESFGVKQDDQHIFIYDKVTPVSTSSKQRSSRAFCVVIDALTDEKFYGEGRISHIIIFNELVKRINKGKEDAFAESVFYKSNAEPSRYIYFKGFIDTNNFSHLSPESARVLKTPIFDDKGEEIKTPTNWFITDHNLPNQA